MKNEWIAEKYPEEMQKKFTDKKLNLQRTKTKSGRAVATWRVRRNVDTSAPDRCYQSLSVRAYSGEAERVDAAAKSRSLGASAQRSWRNTHHVTRKVARYMYHELRMWDWSNQD